MTPAIRFARLDDVDAIRALITSLLPMMTIHPNGEGAEQFIDFQRIPEEISKIIIELHPGVMGQEVMYNIVATLIGLGFRVAREENDTFVFLRK